MGNALELSIAILNGAVGDYLAARGNGLSTPMTFVAEGQPLALTASGLARHPELGPRLAQDGSRVRLAVYLHGLMCTEEVWNFPAEKGGGPPTTYGSRLAAEADLLPLFVRYNTGLSIAENGRLLDALLRELLTSLAPLTTVEELSLIGYSMGGLVIRSACRRVEGGSSSWLGKVRRCVYVGTPHQGAPLERVGRGLTKLLAVIPDPIVHSVGELIDVRSRGVKDLGDAVLADGHRGQRGEALPLTPGIDHFLIAGSLVRHPHIAELLGDFMVPLPSGSDGHKGLSPRETELLPAAHIEVVFGKSHVGVAHDEDVYQAIRRFCGVVPAILPPTGDPDETAVHLAPLENTPDEA
jgi:triacylglycerol lipase